MSRLLAAAIASTGLAFPAPPAVQARVSVPFPPFPPCVPARAPTHPGAQCALDIWGIVTNTATGAPQPNAELTDGSNVSSTDADGYYVLHEYEPAAYTVSASCPWGSVHQESRTDTVYEDPGVLVTGNGKRQDFSLRCS